jgi:hypothetical protein
MVPRFPSKEPRGGTVRTRVSRCYTPLPSSLVLGRSAVATPGAGQTDRSLGASGRSVRAPTVVTAVTILLLAGLGLRLIIAYVLYPGSGFETDIASFTAWAQTLVAHGPGGFYASVGFADYPRLPRRAVGPGSPRQCPGGDHRGRPDLGRDGAPQGAAHRRRHRHRRAPLPPRSTLARRAAGCGAAGTHRGRPVRVQPRHLVRLGTVGAGGLGGHAGHARAIALLIEEPRQYGRPG